MSWPSLARRQAGAISHEQLRADGLADRAITRLTASGALVRAARGTFVVRGAPVTTATWMWVAVLTTRGVVGFASAAYVWGVSERPVDVHVIVAPDRRVSRPRGVVVRHLVVPTAVIVTRQGLPVTSRSWTLLDHVSTLRFAQAERLVDRALQRGWLTRDDLRRRLTEFPGRRGNAMIRRLLDLTSDGAAARSERLLHSILRENRITGWLPNYEVWHDDQLVAIVDVAVVDALLAIEVDGMAHHTNPDRFQSDRVRQNRLVSLGWTVVRFTWSDVSRNPNYVLTTVRTHLSRGS